MINTGILRSGDKVELLEGVLVPKMTLNPPHRIATKKTRRAIEPLLPEEWEYDSQAPITLLESVPEPDGMVYRSVLDQITERHPTPAEVALVIEIAESSLDDDRIVMHRIYAAARIPVYWIGNLPERKVEVYEEPTGAGIDAEYRRRRDFGMTDEVPLVLMGLQIGVIAVANLLP